MTYAAILGDCKCECSDPGCKHHKGASDCRDKALQILYRIDMQDETGTAFCDNCADDAFSSGLFTTHDDEIEEN